MRKIIIGFSVCRGGFLAQPAYRRDRITAIDSIKASISSQTGLTKRIARFQHTGQPGNLRGQASGNKKLFSAQVLADAGSKVKSTQKEKNSDTKLKPSSDQYVSAKYFPGSPGTIWTYLAEALGTSDVVPSSCIFPVLVYFLVFCAGLVGATGEGFSYEGSGKNEMRWVRTAQTPSYTSQKEEISSPETNVQSPPVYEDANAAEQKMRMLRQPLHADEIQDNDRPIIGESDPGQDICIPLVFNEAVEHYIRYFTTTKRDLFKRWLRKKKRYAPLIKEVLREYGLPEDLVYLAMIESGFNLHACSPMKAAGPWQFIPETGRRYGLVVNHWVDERRDIRKSTIAAARYLQELFDQFGCWHLAAAGYNAGENRIDRLIRRHDTKDFWQLRTYNTLPRETREYVPQLIAAAIIAKDPEKYGLGQVENIPAFEFIKETVPGGVPLTIVAEAASIDLSSIRAFNPEIRRGITPPGKNYRIKLPAGTDRVNFRSSLTSILNARKRVAGVIRHLIGRRDNIRKITRRYGVSKEDLVLVNGGPLGLKKGKLVYIPRFDDAKGEARHGAAETADFRKKVNRNTVRSKRRAQGTDTHVVRRGESLSVIAAKYGMDVRTLKRINRLRTDHIECGKKLSLAGHIKKTPRRIGKKYHRVSRGDTLSGIAGKYGKSVSSIRRMNRLKGDSIRRGMLLRVSSSRTISEQAFIKTCSKTSAASLRMMVGS